MLLSVIIPTCNRNELLAICLEQLKPGSQSLHSDEFEVIVADDSKNFGAGNFLYDNYPWVRYIKGPQKGPASNRNMGAKQAKGEWLVFLDDDCEPNPKLLETYYNAIKKGWENELVFEGGIHAEGLSKNPYDFAPIKYESGSLWSCNFCIHKPLFEDLNGFDENFKFPHMEDKDLQERLLKRKTKIHFLSGAFVVHPWRTIHNGWVLGKREEMLVYFSIKHRYPITKWALIKKIFFYYLARLKRPNAITIFPRILKDFFLHSYTILIYFNKWQRKYQQ